LCKALIRLHLHNPNCEHCGFLSECWSEATRRRLKELLDESQSPPKTTRSNDAA